MTVIGRPPALPRWDTSDVFESLLARAFVDGLEQVGADATRAVALFDELGIESGVSGPVTPERATAADRAITALNTVMDRLRTIRATVAAAVATDSADEPAQALATRVATVDAALQPLLARLSGWVAALGVEALCAASPVAAEHAGPLAQFARRAEHQMPDAHEGLVAALRVDGSSAWGRLHSDITSQLEADVHVPTGSRRLPIAAIRGLATDPDPAVRRAAYDAELLTWPSVGTVCAAAMNSIKGEAITLNRRRHWPSALDAALFANSVDRRTFDAMQTAVVRSLPDFRRWMRTKAELHEGGHDRLAWWDLVAPLPFAPAPVGWDEGVGLVRGAFAGYSPELGSLVDRSVDERWLDAEPRAGKRGGAFCMSFIGDRSLVLMNWSDGLDSVQTLAHELGHAFHNTRLAVRTSLQRQLPMALAETASIFCETLMVEAALARATGTERLAALDVDLQGATQIVVDIHSRFLFEQEVFTRRERKSLGVSELCDMMLATQDQAYGDGLDQATAHPWMWAVKPHYYGSHFYNWPYTYGLLFGLGLYAEHVADPERFGAGYDDLLSRCGMNTAEELGRAFGLDVGDEAFWEASLDVLRRRMADYEALAATALATGRATPSSTVRPT